MSDNYGSNLRRPPRTIPAAPSTTTKAGITAVGAASTAPLQIVPSASLYGQPGLTQGWYDFVSMGCDSCVIFGDANVGAATTNCMVIPQGTVQPYFITGDSAYVRVIALSGSGTLRWAQSDR